MWSPRGVQNARGVQMESKSLSRKSCVFIEGCLYVIDQTSLKRLASAVRFRPWPPLKSITYGGFRTSTCRARIRSVELPHFAGRDEIDYLTIIPPIHAEVCTINC